MLSRAPTLHTMYQKSDRSGVAANCSRLLRQCAKTWLVPGIIAAEFFEYLTASILQFTLTWYFVADGTASIWIALLNVATYVPLALGGLCSSLFVQKIGARQLLLASKAAALVACVLFVLLYLGEILRPAAVVAIALLAYAFIAVALTAQSSAIRAVTRWAGVRLVTYNAGRSGVIMVGPLLGFSIGGVVVEQYGVLPALEAACGFGVLSLLMTGVAFPRSRTSASTLSVSGWLGLTRRTFAAMQAAGMSLLLVSACAVLFATQLTFNGVIAPLDIQTNSLSASTLAAVNIVATMLSVLGAVLAPFAESRLPLRQLTGLGCGVACVALVGITPQHDGTPAMLLLTAGLLAVILGLLGPIFMTHLQRAVPVPLVAHAVGTATSLPLIVSPVLMIGVGVALPGHRQATLIALATLMAVAGLAVLLAPRSRPRCRSTCSTGA